MAVVDQLVVTLTLDPKDFQKGEAVVMRSQKRMREEADRTDKQFQASARSIGDALNRTRNIALGLLTVFTAGRGISSFVQQTTESSAALGRMSRDLQVSTQALSAWEAVSRRAGNSAGEIGGAFSNISNAIQRFRLTGDASAIAGFRALRVQTSDSNGRVRNTDDILQDALDAIGRRAPQERLTAAGLIGGGQELVNLSAIPRDRRLAMMAEGRSADQTPEQVAAATRLRDAYLRMERALTAVGNKLVESLTPGIVAVADALRSFGEFLMSDDFRPVWERLARNVRDFVDYIGGDEFKDSMKALGVGIVELAEKIVAALRWLGVIPSSAAAATPGSTATVAPSFRDRLVSAVTGRTPEEQQRMRLEREAREAAPRLGPRADAATGPAGGRLAPAAFRERFGEYAREAARQTGVSEDIILGQMALETDWGRSFAGRNNPFNLTARAGVDATEGGDTDGQGRPIRQRFQNFNSPAEAAAEYAGRLRRLWPNAVGAGDDIGAFARGLRPGQQGGYAEAPNYGLSLRDTARRFRAAPPVGAPPDPAAMQAPRPGASNTFGGNNTSTSEVSIGAISIQTASTDAAGLAKDLAPALRRYTFVEQATVGLV